MNFAAYQSTIPPVLLVERASGVFKSVPNPEFTLREEALIERFRVDALKELGLDQHPKAEEIWEFAFVKADYKNRGFRWVYYYLEKISEFIRAA